MVGCKKNEESIMLKMFEKLINEHGSSTILRERIVLISEKYSTLEDKLSLSEQRNAILESENQKLNSELYQAKQEIQRLNEIIKTNTKACRPEKLNKIQEEILQYFFKSGSDIPINHFASSFNLDMGTTQYHVDILIKRSLIEISSYTMDSSWIGQQGEALYSLTSEGRGYVVENIQS